MARTRADDACPGALQLHQAADGALARVRLPGGMLGAAELHALAVIAVEFGSGTLELTTRSSLQVRGIAPGDEAAVAAAVAAAGLLPAPAHERVRNIIASPLTGRSGGDRDVRDWVRDLDAAIGADPDLAALPGRFLFALDDGRGDVAGLGADVGARACTDGSAALLLGGADTGLRLAPETVVDTLIAVARRFLAVRATAWRVTELPDAAALLDGLTPADGAAIRPDRGARVPVAGGPPVGWIDQDRPAGLVSLGAAVPLGVLPARTAEFLAAIEAPLVVTPWRSVLVCDLTEAIADTALRVLAPMGLVFDAGSRWLSVSACTGSPGCAKSRADVRADAAAVVAGGPIHLDGGVVEGPAVNEVRRLHLVGCERACGNPHDGRLLIATGSGYRPEPDPAAALDGSAAAGPAQQAP